MKQFKKADLHTPYLDSVNFRIWKPFNLTIFSTTAKSHLKKLEPVPAIPMHELRVTKSDLRNFK